jgi:protein phosphatase-4 regulatory subunit 3
VHGAVAVNAQNGAASPVVKPLVDYPDDDEDENAMDTKPEADEVQTQQTPQEEDSTADIALETQSTPVSLSIQTPPERLSEKRRREEEDDDELVKLTSGPKRRSSTSSSSGSAGLIRRKRGMSIGTLSTAEKGTTQNLSAGLSGAAPKRIAINLGPAVKPATSETESNDSTSSHTSNEKENRVDGVKEDA